MTPTVSEINPVHISQLYLSSILILFSDAHLFFQVVPFLGDSHRNTTDIFLFFHNRAIRPAHPVFIDLITKKIWRGQPNIKFFAPYLSPQIFFYFFFLG